MNKTQKFLKKTGIIGLITNTLIASTIGYTGIIKDKKGNTPQENINIEWTNQEKTTTMNEQGEIMRARARGPPTTFYRQPLFIESLQAIAKLYDSGGTDPPILTSTENGLIINELGKKLLSFIYFVHPNTRI